MITPTFFNVGVGGFGCFNGLPLNAGLVNCGRDWSSVAKVPASKATTKASCVVVQHAKGSVPCKCTVVGRGTFRFFVRPRTACKATVSSIGVPVLLGKGGSSLGTAFATARETVFIFGKDAHIECTNATTTGYASVTYSILCITSGHADASCTGNYHVDCIVDCTNTTKCTGTPHVEGLVHCEQPTVNCYGYYVVTPTIDCVCDTTCTGLIWVHGSTTSTCTVSAEYHVFVEGGLATIIPLVDSTEYRVANIPSYDTPDTDELPLIIALHDVASVQVIVPKEVDKEY